MNNINQYADNIFNANLIYVDGKIHKVNRQSDWYFDLGKSSGRFSYKNELISLIGRDAEIQWLKNFMHQKTNFFVSAITGRAGNGKSSLVYSFYKNNVNKDEWYVLGVNYECLNDFLITEIIKHTQVLLVIDYVLMFADEIGEWIKRLYGIMKDEENVKIRILLIERAHVVEGREPYWYSILVKKHNLDEICPYNSFLRMNDLEEESLREIFVQYIHKYGNEKDKREYKVDLPLIFERIDNDCKTPLFILYIAQAWIDDEKRNIRNWDRESLLTYIEKKEEGRIESIFKDKDVSCTESLKKILVFSMVLSGIELGMGIPNCLNHEFEVVRNNISNNINLKRLFMDMAKYDWAKVRFSSALPEIVEEFYCLNYLKHHKDNFEFNFTKKFVDEAWREDPQSFAGFLCRVIEDFPDNEMTSFDEILACPTGDEMTKILYADVIREYTYWNQDVKIYSDKILDIFSKILSDCNERDVKAKYAVTLFNMVWNSCTYVKYNKDYQINCATYMEKLRAICAESKDEFIQDVYNQALKKLRKEQIIVN